MTMHTDDTKLFPPEVYKTDDKRESFMSFCKRQATGLNLVSDEMEQERREQREIADLQAKCFERKRKLLFDNLDLILRHREEILATPRYRNIDVHYAVDGGGCYIGPLRTTRQFNFAGTLVNINLKLGALLEVWDTDQFKAECKCGCTAVIYYFAGSPLSGSSIATAFCPKCKEKIHGISNRRFGDYYGLLKNKLDKCIEMVAKSFAANCRAGSEFRGNGEYCDLETMINELKMREYEEKCDFGEEIKTEARSIL